MAYYSSSYNGNDLCEYYQTPYASAYDSLLPQGSVPYPSHEPGFHNLFDYNPTPYYRAYDSIPSCSTIISYSTSTFTEPKSIQYDPNFYGATFNYPQTRFVISYSVTDNNSLPKYDEYDPTPYGGGYDIDQTYGKPLPPSEKTCYPRSTPETNNAPSFNDVTDVSTKLFGEKEEVDEQAAEPHNGSNTIQANEEEQHNQGKPFQGEQNVDTGDNYQPWSGQGSTYENGLKEGNSYGYAKQVSQYPSGSGLEALDLCESIFGYWPCLSRYANKNANACCPQVPHEGCYGNQWKGTADYLFGSSYPYGEKRDGEGNYGEPVYSYERHSQEQPLYRQVQYED